MRATRRRAARSAIPFLLVAAFIWWILAATRCQPVGSERELDAWHAVSAATTTAAAAAQRTALFMVNVGSTFKSSFGYANYTLPAWRSYAAHHGYPFILIDDPWYDNRLLGPTWWRVRAVHNLLARCERASGRAGERVGEQELGGSCCLPGVETAAVNVNLHPPSHLLCPPPPSGLYDFVLHVDADSLPVRPALSVANWTSTHGGAATLLWLSDDVGPRRHAFGNGGWLCGVGGGCVGLAGLVWVAEVQAESLPHPCLAKNAHH